VRAFVLKRYGGPEATELAEIPAPEPGPTGLLVQVHAAALNPVDYKTRRGALLAIYRYRLPAVMGKDFAGVVVGRGSRAKRFTEGDRVFGRVAADSMGALAEYVAVDESLAAKMPALLDFAAAAGVPLAALTALQCLRDELDVRSGQRIIIAGAAGGVGGFAIQIAKWLGAEVTATASPAGLALVRRLGADRVLDYTRGRLEELPSHFDGGLDLVGGETLLHLFATVKRGGKVVSTAGPPEPQTALKDLGRGFGLATLFWLASTGAVLQAARHGVRYRYKFMHPSGAELAELAGLIDAGRIEVVLDRVFPLARTADAFAYLEQGHAKGKVVVRIRDN
jgi:NADPH:quinone reductase-like Zn-dependent oxidoreductase